MINWNKQLGEAVKNIRLDAGLDQISVRKTLRMSKSAYSDLENGLRSLKFSEALTLMDFYGITFEEFSKYIEVRDNNEA